MITIQGRLEFTNWFNVIKIKAGEDFTNLWNYLEMFLVENNGKPATWEEGKEGFKILLNEESESVIEFERVDNSAHNSILMLLKNKEGRFGFGNLVMYMITHFMRLNGCLVTVTISEECISLCRNMVAEQPYELYCVDDISNVPIPAGIENEICKIGQGKECCIFCSIELEGFSCLKFYNQYNHILLDRYSKNEMNAGRIGNCIMKGDIKNKPKN